MGEPARSASDVTSHVVERCADREYDEWLEVSAMLRYPFLLQRHSKADEEYRGSTPVHQVDHFA